MVENITHTLPGAEAPLLRNVSLALKPGESLGILGLSGAGKSTLANLMVGAWKPQRGAIRLDHATLDQWDDDELGPHIGYLPQYPSLLTGTLAQNIARMGEPDDEAVVAAGQARRRPRDDPSLAARLRHPGGLRRCRPLRRRAAARGTRPCPLRRTGARVPSRMWWELAERDLQGW